MTNNLYVIAKICGIKLCESYNRQHGTDYRLLMPTNLCGPRDNYHPENSHVVDIDENSSHAQIAIGDIIVRVDQRYHRPAEVETLLKDSGFKVVAASQ